MPSLDAQHLSSIYGLDQHVTQEVLDHCRGSKKAAELVLAGSAALNIGPREAAQGFAYAVRRHDSEAPPELIQDPAVLPAVIALADRAASVLQEGGPPGETNLEVCQRHQREVGISLAVRLTQLLTPR